MNFRNSVYFIREAFISLARNKLLTFAAVSTVAICILILGIAILIGINASSFLNRLESDIEIVAFLDKELTESQIADIGQQLKELDGIQTVDFVSKEEALQMLQENLGGKEYDLEETLGDNPLPATYEIKAQDPHDVPDIAAEVEKIYGIYKVNYGQGIVEKLFNVTKWIRIISCIFMILLVMGAVFLIATTIRLAIFARRKEIYLMKLIGATDWFVRWPFVIEGVLLGFGGALLAVMILGAGYSSLINRMAYMYFLPLVTSSDVLMEIYASLLAAGAVLGILGTFISLNRFLDV
ncbi:MAG: ABC transporter permease [Syntrophomonadaceae bacterium]|nr:ABC transporter permease [Syntrophomonadaceae bacterium]